MSHVATPPSDLATLGALRAADHRYRPVREEIRTNLLAMLAAGTPRFSGLVGFDETVLPQLERALLSGHDVILLGERGQGKTRLLRALVSLLDEWTPAIAGAELHDHPLAPTSPAARRAVAEHGEATPVVWRHRSERYTEKLATPDTSVGDLIGDVDPVRLAEGRSLADPETIHYGLVPRANRGVLAVNELPDLPERIQVALLNVLEERDLQIRGYTLRLPLDLLVVASANPEDYTSRGRIVTPLKDRFGAEVRTHYPLRLDDEIALLRQEADLDWGPGPLGHPVVPDHVVETVARFTRLVRAAPQVDHRSGVSARFAITALETVAAAAVRRAALTGEDEAVARPVDLPTAVPAVRGKVELDELEDEHAQDLLTHLLRRALAETFRARLGGADLDGLLKRFTDGITVETGELIPAADVLAAVGPVPGLARLLERLGADGAAERPGVIASALELALDGLHLTRRIAKEELPGRVVYGP